MIRVGVGGWTYAPWRGSFYPKDLPQTQELGFASRHLTSIEVNGTFYRTQSPATFRKWASEAPDGFVFALKGPGYVTNRRELRESGPSIARFLESGITELDPKLGPILWQLAHTKRFIAEVILQSGPDGHPASPTDGESQWNSSTYCSPCLPSFSSSRSLL